MCADKESVHILIRQQTGLTEPFETLKLYALTSFELRP